MVRISSNRGNFRPAGYRIPIVGDIYVGKDGAVKVRDGVSANMVIDGFRLILRCRYCGQPGCMSNPTTCKGYDAKT